MILPLVTWLDSLDIKSPFFAACELDDTVPVISAKHFQACAYNVIIRQVDERDLKMSKSSVLSLDGLSIFIIYFHYVQPISIANKV